MLTTGFISRGWGEHSPPSIGSGLPLLRFCFTCQVHGKVLMLWIKMIPLALSSKSYDFGVVRIKHRIASGGCAPQTPCFGDVASLYSDSLFQDPTT